MTPAHSDKSDAEVMQDMAVAAQAFADRFGVDDLIQALQDLIDTLHKESGLTR